MKKERFEKKRGVLLAAVILFLVSLAPSRTIASDFDFYADDLISRESYRHISMDFKDALLKDILKIFSEQAGLNFIAAQNIQDRTVTLYLDDVPLQEALNKIMAANNLTYELEPGGNVFVVKEWGRPDVETITKVYQLKYARLASSKLEEAANKAGTCGTSGGAAAGGGGGPTQGLEQVIKDVLTPRGKVQGEARTNMLMVTDIPSQFEVIDRVVALLDVPAPQVMIEVEMLDVSKNTVDDMGVKLSGRLLALQGSETDTRFPSFLKKGSIAAPQAFTYGTLTASVFTALLEFITQDTRTKYLARPRILTMSNQSALIKITTDESIGVKSETNSSEGTATTTVEAERYETGVSLQVTPQVDADTGMVTMFVQPTVTEARTGKPITTISGTVVFRDPEVRTSSSTLMVKDGETIVVGGLIRSIPKLETVKIPFLGDLPLLGAAFRHKHQEANDRELIVFITPRIVARDNAVALAKAEISAPAAKLPREQSSRVARKDKVDDMLESWDY